MSWQPWQPSQASQTYSQSDATGTGNSDSNDQLLSLLSNEENEYENEEEIEHYNEKDSILFLIDCHKPMFEDILKDEDESKPFYFALKCAIHAYCDKIISADSDLVGVVFFGTREKKNQFDFENIYIYRDMDVPDANTIKEMESLVADKDEFEQVYGHAQQKSNFHEALWTCQHLFSHVPKNVGYKRVFLFTNDDDPTGSDASARKKCMERVKDLMESDITIELFIVKPKDKNFDPSIFWERVIAKSDDDYTGRITFDFAERFKELREKVRRKEFKKRQRMTLPLEIGDMSLSVSMYTLVKKATKNKNTWLHADTNKPIRSETKYLCEDTGAELMSSDMKFAWDYGQERAVFTKDEVLEMQKLGTKGFKLMGFKPRSKLELYHNYRTSTFIYPNEKDIQGSTTAFVALYKKMLEMDKIAICRLIEREGKPIYVALLPQPEQVDDDGAQIEPPGFHVIYLPYADGIRELDLPEREAEATEKQVMRAKKLVQKLYIDFSSYNFENPSIQQHYASLQALALDHDKIDKITDYTLPDEEGMTKYKKYIDAFKDAVYSASYDAEANFKKSSMSTSRKRKIKEEVKEEEEEEEKPKKKRKKETKKPERRKIKKEPKDDEEDEPPKKKQKKKEVKKEETDDEEEEEEEEEIDMVQLIKTGEASKLPKDVLKEFCRIYKLKLSGNKDDLIERITEFLRSRGKIK